MIISPANLYHISNLYNPNPSFQGKTANIKTEKLLEFINIGKPVREIAKELGISVHSYYRLLTERNIEYRKQKLAENLQNISKRRIIFLYLL